MTKRKKEKKQTQRESIYTAVITALKSQIFIYYLFNITFQDKIKRWHSTLDLSPSW